ncbi:hypothetical protein pb186bvf_006458 [Paramecium bursaria]
MVLGGIQSLQLKEQGVGLLDVSLYLDKAHSDCLYQIQLFQDLLSNLSKSLLKKVDLYYINLKEQVKEFAANQKPTHQVLDAFTTEPNKENLKNWLRELLKIYSFNQNGDPMKLNLYQGVLEACEQQNQTLQLADKLNEMIQDIEKKPQPITAIAFQEPLQNINFQFSATLKGANIVVTNNVIAEQKQSESNGQRFIICEPMIPKNAKNGITKFAFKVIKYAGWIGIGVCHKDIIVNSSYKFHYTTIGHGSYLVSNNAYSWSHLQKELNSAHKSFEFAANDIIIVEVDYHKKKITWQKRKGPQKFSMDIDTTLDLYPCANLCSPGDTVEILNKID